MPVTYRIHPAIGIARVGDSPDDFFVGPEAPGIPPTLEKLGETSAGPRKYQDALRRVRRQGARFRVYEHTLDDAGAVTGVREITGADADIEWEVRLANGKAAAPRLEGGGRRNKGVPEPDLVVDAGAHRISGPSQPMQEMRGTFMKSIDVKLGDLLTDADGRLIVLGGHGTSQSVPSATLEHFADNDGWCDDTSDGPVRATVRLHNTAETISADPAWVVVAPPDFAPAIENLVTLYDAVYDVMARLDPALAVGEATAVSFTRDIYPILRRISNLHWVSKVAARHHGEGKRHHFLSHLSVFASNHPDQAPDREEVFFALRTPDGKGGGNMPKLPALAVSKAPGAAVTEQQYRRMERWSQGTFLADWTGKEPRPRPLDKLKVAARPPALDRAALEACVGGPFFPGIEVSRVMLDDATYDAARPFRIHEDMEPGGLTARMAVPWQADFNACSIQEGADWWPGQRPNEVRRDGETHAPWTPKWGPQEMIDGWSQLGFVVPVKVGNKIEYEEDERFIVP